MRIKNMLGIKEKIRLTNKFKVVTISYVQKKIMLHFVKVMLQMHGA
jgi:hypothetical protein